MQYKICNKNNDSLCSCKVVVYKLDISLGVLKTN